MRYKLPLIIAVVLSAITTVNAQVKFNFNGLGRAIVTSNEITQTQNPNDTTSYSKGISGYALFDLQPNLSISNNIKANMILRLKNPFGSFFGQGTTLNFRQFNISGNIARKVRFEIGDIYFGDDYSTYTMHNPVDMFTTFESSLFKERREILEYEAFIVNNNRRLQGVNLASDFAFDSGSVLSKIGLRAFALRTNPTNDLSVPDRLMVGGKLFLINDKFFDLGATSINLTDVSFNNAAFNYNNNVLSLHARLKYVADAFNVQLGYEFAFSKFKYEEVVTRRIVEDAVENYVHDISLAAAINPAMSKVFFNYRMVGADFNSPSAQTTRLDVKRNPMLFDSLFNVNGNQYFRPQMLWDRFSDEGIYLNSLKPTLYTFNPIYNNLNPYGDATPNRVGITVGVKADTSFQSKGINYLFRYDSYNEIIGERTPEKRAFSVITGGVSVDIKNLLKLDRSWIALSYGIRMENTTRSGAAPVDLASTSHDIGITIEPLKKFEILGGIKLFSAKGTEVITTRDMFNQIDDAVVSPTDFDLNETIWSFGGRFRFFGNSFISAHYNNVTYKNMVNSMYDYTMHQVFANFTVKF